MDSIHVDRIKLEKASAFCKYGQLQKLSNLFRVIEVCIILIILSKFSCSQLPTLKSSISEYFKCFSIIISSPRFVFLVGNAIIITLFALSGHFTSTDSSQNDSVPDVYEEFVQNSEKMSEFRVEKQTTTCEEKTIMVDTCNSITTISTVDTNNLGLKKYMRSKSDSENYERVRPVLRRTVTESCQKSKDSGEKGDSLVEEKLSNEEFKRAVEAFIARQKKFLREEDFSPLAIV